MASVVSLVCAPNAHIFPKNVFHLSTAIFNVNRRHFQSTVPATSRLPANYDVVVVGGGLVGTAMACALGCSKILSEKRILLLEGASYKPYVPQDSYSNRVSAINSSSVGLFKDLGVWNKMLEHRVKEVKKMQVWDACSLSCITFNHDDMADPVAHIVENDLILWALSDRLKDFRNVSVVYNSKIKQYLLPNTKSNVVRPKLVFEDGSSVECDLLIGADGANSKIRSLMQVRYLSQSYNQMGVVATLKLAEKTDNVVAWQRFLPTGPIALLPLSDDTSSLVWSTTSAHAKDLIALPNELFVSAVNEAFIKQYTLSSFVMGANKKFSSFLEMINMTSHDVPQLAPQVKYVDQGSRACFPLGVGNASRYATKSAALVGDAAHRVHPLAGQGVNLGFGDVHCLAHLVEAAVYNGAHIGKGKHLSVYESERLSYDVPKILGIHLLHNLYNTSFTPIVTLRSLGLSLVHALPSLKKRIMEEASL